MRVFWLVSLLSIFACTAMTAQVAETKKGHNELYKTRIKKEYLNDVYIPKDLKDAFSEIVRLSDKESIKSFKGADEDLVVKKLYFSLGRWITVNWGFYGGSRLSHRLKKQYHVTHPEDQAVFIIRAFHRDLNKKDLKLKEMSKDMRETRLKARREAADKMVPIGKRKRTPKK